MTTSPSASGSAEQTAREVHDSPVLEHLARLGLAARGTVWLVVGLLGVQVARGRDQRTDREGALRAIADEPFGEVLLVVLVVGFAGYALWRLLEAAVGARGDDGAKRTGKRLLSATKAVLYGFLAVTTARTVLGSGGSGDRTSSTTAQVMEHSGGRLLVGAVGLLVVGTGLGTGVRALQGKHAERLDPSRLPARRRTLVERTGTAGLLGRGLVLALLGAFLTSAAWRFDPQQAKGLDAALDTLAGQAYGRLLVGLAVLGVLAYALWSYAEAAYRRI